MSRRNRDVEIYTADSQDSYYSDDSYESRSEDGSTHSSDWTLTDSEDTDDTWTISDYSGDSQD